MSLKRLEKTLQPFSILLKSFPKALVGINTIKAIRVIKTSCLFFMIIIFEMNTAKFGIVPFSLVIQKDDFSRLIIRVDP